MGMPSPFQTPVQVNMELGPNIELPRAEDIVTVLKVEPAG